MLSPSLEGWNGWKSTPSGLVHLFGHIYIYIYIIYIYKQKSINLENSINLKNPYTQLHYVGWSACEVVIVSEDTCTQPLDLMRKKYTSYSTEETTALFLHFMILDNQHIGKDVGMTPQLTLFGQPHHAAERGRDRPFGSLREQFGSLREHL